MSVRIWVWLQEWSSLFKEIVDISILGSLGGGTTGSLGFSENVEDYLGQLLLAQNLSFSQLSLLLGDNGVQVGEHLLFESLFSFLRDLVLFVFMGNMSVVDIIGEELERMLVIGDEFEVSIQLINHSSFSSVLDLISKTFADHGDEEESSQSQDEDFFELFITIEVLFSMSGEVSVTLVSSQERVMVVSTSDTHSSLRVRRSWGVKVLWMPVVLPSSSDPEDTFISNFIVKKQVIEDSEEDSSSPLPLIVSKKEQVNAKK